MRLTIAGYRDLPEASLEYDDWILDVPDAWEDLRKQLLYGMTIARAKKALGPTRKPTVSFNGVAVA